MHELYELKEMLMDELKEYGSKKDMSTGSLDVVDKLSHTIKNLCKIIEDMEDEQYSMANEDMMRVGQSYRRGDNRSYRDRGNSYARGRGRNARRDSMGRYSSEGGYSQAMDDMADELRSLMEDAPDERTKQEFQRFIKKIEQM
jgi:hypothetical protein